MSAHSAAILRRAAEIVESRGWCQNAPEDDAGRVCAARALGVAEGELGADPQDLWLFEAVAEHVGADYLHSWNDEPERTPAEVLTAFREVAALKDPHTVGATAVVGAR